MGTYEKKYKEANDKVAARFGTNVAKEIFTDLYESEDERIRKELIKEINGLWENDSATWPSSLEKKNKYIAWLEKQSEQKPADNTEPKFKVRYAGNEYNVFEIKEIAGIIYYGIEDEPNHIDYILPNNCEIVSGYSYGVKEKGSPYPTESAIFSEQKPTDEEIKELFRIEYEKVRADAISERQKPAWSEEDNIILSRIIADYERSNEEWFNAQNSLPHGRKITWLKSIKERCTWRPSEEQLDALKRTQTGVIQFNVLQNLYSDLKKLSQS